MKDVFIDINSTKSVYSRLWNIALRGVANRECGALEAADTLMSHALFGTDPNTTFKWIDVGLLRSRRVKSKKELEKMDPNDTDLFFPSLIDVHYPNRPQELEDLCLYDYVKDWDIVDKEPSKEPVPLFYRYGKKKFLRQREHPHIVQHVKFNPKQRPEDYYYSLLLLFKPWRKLESLKGQHKTYTEAFAAQKDKFQEAMRYHEKLSEIQEASDKVMELIEQKAQELGAEGPKEPVEMPKPEELQFRHEEAQRAMEEFQAAANQGNDENLSTLESQLNSDQLRVYEHVKDRLTYYVESISKIKVDSDDKIFDKTNPLIQFVSGVGGTGKSFLIKVIILWVRQVLKKQVAITAPTGIAAFSIGGQTVHRILQLPTEHDGKTLKYTRLSDTVLEVLRNNLQDVVLFIIDEISMVSNVTLMMIHLRLSEIFDTHERAPFGCRNIMAFGDLLQLPPVKSDPPFKDLSRDQMKNHFAAISNLNLWQKYFTNYDELQINMRQKSDQSFCQLLSNVRLGFCTTEDLRILRNCQISFKENLPEKRLDELARFVLSEDFKGLCILPTKEMCATLNEAVLKLLPGDEIRLVAEDTVDCKQSERSKAEGKLASLEDKASETAGLEKEIILKKGARVMLKRNLDVTLGYCNGATGTVLDVNQSRIHLQMENSILDLEPVDCKFELLPGIYVHRKQFPITVAYGITVHKSQGLSLDTAMVDVGNRIFSHGQTYVALSRVKTLKGLSIINLDPKEIQASNQAIIEYNRLRMMTSHLRTAKPLQQGKNEHKKIRDNVWAPRKKTVPVVQGSTPTPKKGGLRVSGLPGFKNEDQVSSYANATLQCLLSYEPLKNTLRCCSDTPVLANIACQYKYQSKALLSADGVRSECGLQFADRKLHDPTVFLLALIDRSETLKRTVKFIETIVRICKTCSAKIVEAVDRSILRLPSIDQNKINVTDLLNKSLSLSEIQNSSCQKCGKETVFQRSELHNLKEMLVIELPLWVIKPDGSLVKNTKLRSPGLQTTTIRVGNNRYKLHGALFHHGSEIEFGHCSALVVSGKKFISAHDDKISQEKWPTGSVNAQLLFYRKVDPTNIGPRQKKSLPFNDGPPATNSTNIANRRQVVDGLSKASVPQNRMLDVNVPSSWNPRNTARRRLELNESIAQTDSDEASKTVCDVSKWPRFENKLEDGEKVSCYANATVQALLSYEPLRLAFANRQNVSALKTLASLFHNCGGTPLSTFEVRTETNIRFSIAEQQCAREFMDALITKHCILKEKTKFTRVLELKCNSCNSVRTNFYEENILAVPISGGKKNIAELLETSFAWYQPADNAPKCDNRLENGEACAGKCFTREFIRDPSDLLVIQVNRSYIDEHGNLQKDDNFQVMNLPSTILSFEGQHFKLHADIRHHGQNSISGHYTAVVQSGSRQFYHTDDENVTVYKWTAKCGKQSYLLLYKRFKPTRNQN